MARVRLLESKLAKLGLIEIKRAAVRSERRLKPEAGSSSLCSLQAETQEPSSEQWLRFDWQQRLLRQHCSMNRGFLASN